jgi:hypothetical protein
VLGQARASLGDVAQAQVHFTAAADAARARAIPRFASEMQVFGAVMQTALGDPDGALAAIEAVQQAAPVDDGILRVWARTIGGQLRVRVDADAAPAEVERALDRARRIDHPACVAVNLHSLTYLALQQGDLASAVRAVAEMLENVVRRGAVSELRAAFGAIAALSRPAATHGSIRRDCGSRPFVSLLDVPASSCSGVVGRGPRCRGACGACLA